MKFLIVLLIGLIISTIVGVYTNDSGLIGVLDIISFMIAGLIAYIEEKHYWRERGIE